LEHDGQRLSPAADTRVGVDRSCLAEEYFPRRRWNSYPSIAEIAQRLEQVTRSIAVLIVE
jgi:hypothetical protein